MVESKRSQLTKRFNVRHLSVTFLLLALLVLIPLVSQVVAVTVLIIALSISASLVNRWSARPILELVTMLVLAIGLSAVVIVSGKSDRQLLESPVGFAVVMVLLLLLFFCAFNIIVSLLRAQRVTADEVAGGLNFYLIIGFIWANVYEILVLVNPNSFNVKLEGEALFNKMVYFSFVTMTTLGYGDVTPHSPTAEIAVLFQAIMGHMYVPTVVSYLLSVYLSQKLAPAQKETGGGSGD